VHYLNTKIMCMIFMGELTQINIQHLYLNYTNKLMTFAFILYEPMENKFHTIIIVKS